MPRAYTLGKRAEQRAATHRRILDAALSLYEEQGVAATTMLDVARRADVAPGTVANHFRSAEALAAEATTSILVDLRMPTPAIFDGVAALPDRVLRLVGELAAFYERSERWYWVSRREPAGVRAWADAEAVYAADLDTLVRAALGPLAADGAAVTVVSAVLRAWVIGTIQASGRSAGQAVDLVADLLTAWLTTRSGAPADSGRPSKPGRAPRG